MTNPRARHRLTAVAVKNARSPGILSDGAGLRLVVTTAERRRWELRYMRQGRERFMGLGDAEHVTLARARELADEARKLLAEGVDPLDARRSAQQPEAAEAPVAVTFKKAAEDYVTAHEAGWRNPTHRQQWRSTLATYTYPTLGERPVGEITTEDVLAVLEPLWQRVPETASRLRGRIEAILAFATVRGWRDGPNPAVWRGHMQLLLPAKNKVRAVVHHAALDWQEAPAFMAALRTREGIGARALEFAILTAARSGEVRGATWEEIDIARAVWTIPAPRMKAMRPHRVPLAPQTLSLLRRVREISGATNLVFPGAREGRMSDMTLTAVLRRMHRAELTAHGFRSTFRDWCAEATDHANHVAEAALAHVVDDKVEAAYRRGELFSKRVKLMEDWANYLSPCAVEVLLETHRGEQDHPRAELSQRL